MKIEDRLVIDSRLEAASLARTWMAERARRFGFTPEAVNDLKLALTEVVTNVVRHAYCSEPHNQIILSISADDKVLKLTVHDFGRKFQPDSYKPPDLNEPREGGYGIYLMHSLMDEVYYDTSAESGNTLTLVKRKKNDPSLNAEQKI